jgi:3',5'-cyclic AMP phosphodiesterase CpdA
MILIAQISDLHIVPEGTRCYGLVDTNELARRAVNAINRLKRRPNAVVVSGDIIDSARAADYAVAREILGQLEIPFFPVSGNHDLSTGLKTAFSDRQFSASPVPNRLCYGTDVGAIRLVTLDSSVPRAPHGELSAAQLSFLDQELSSANGRPAVVAIHHPPIPTGNRSMDRFGLRKPSELAAVISRHPNVLRILCGHCHRGVLGSFAGSMVTIAPAASHQLELALDGDDTFGFNLEPPAFFLHRWTRADGMTTQFAMIERYPGPYPFVWDDTSNPPSGK